MGVGEGFRAYYMILYNNMFPIQFGIFKLVWGILYIPSSNILHSSNGPGHDDDEELEPASDNDIRFRPFIVVV